MRRFRCKGALVAVAALLLLMDVYWTRGHIPRLQEEERLAESAASVIQVAVAEPMTTVVSFAPAIRPRSAAMRRATALLDMRSAPTTLLARAVPTTPQTLPALAAPLPMAAPLPEGRPATPVMALESGSSPVVWLGSVPLQVAEAAPPAVWLPDGVLPPRKWSPPEGIAYIRWWAA